MVSNEQTGSAPEAMGIKTAPDVWIDELDRWRFKHEIIRNADVLNYFKTNLHRDEEGYFIENRWGDRRELGYLRGVFGFPLRALYLRFLDGLSGEFTLDTGLTAVVGLTELFYLDESTLGFLTHGTNIPVRLSAQAMVRLAERLVIEPEDTVWLQIPESKKITLLRKRRADIFPGVPPVYPEP